MPGQAPGRPSTVATTPEPNGRGGVGGRRMGLARRNGLVAAAVAALVVAACSGGGSSSSGSAGGASPSGGTGGTPDPNGVLKVGQDLNNAFSDNFDPAKGTNDCSYQDLSLIYESVTHPVGNDNVDGGVASSWDLTDPTTLTFHLRSGDRFSDGTPVDSTAVKQSLAHTAGSPQRSSLAVISGMDAPDPMTLVVHLKRPQAGDLLWALTYIDGMIYPASAVASLATKPVGSGPFTLAKYQTGQIISLRANPTYRDPSQYKLAGVDFVQVGSGPQAVTALKSGQVDMIQLRPEDYPTVKADPSLGVSTTPSYDYVTMQLRLNQAPFDNQQVRAALDYAVDRNEINRVVYNGLGEVADQAFPKFSAGYDPALAGTYTYNPAKAKSMLAAAGITTPVSFDMVIPGGEPTFERMAPLLQNEMAPAGFKVNIDRVPGGELFTDVYLHKQGNAVLIVNLSNGPALWSNFGSSYTSVGFTANAFGAVRPEIASLVDQAQGAGTFAGATIGPPMRQASGLVMSEGLEVPVVFETSAIAFNRSRVGGTPTAPIGTCRSNLAGVFIKK